MFRSRHENGAERARRSGGVVDASGGATSAADTVTARRALAATGADGYGGAIDSGVPPRRLSPGGRAVPRSSFQAKSVFANSLALHLGGRQQGTSWGAGSEVPFLDSPAVVRLSVAHAHGAKNLEKFPNSTTHPPPPLAEQAFFHPRERLSYMRAADAIVGVWRVCCSTPAAPCNQR